ncbi:MAG TPA: LLM class flavin-dependent oxidoreductase [Candidatus Limnocylindria bacterium]|nr:LLM class flavin-dependent oxidoreductase [Candidatus Limnocylindria bacterium]
MRFGVFTMQLGPADALIARWHRAEEVGFDSIWVADHTTTQYPELVHFEAWTLLAAMARETDRVRVGTMVTQIAFRHPALLAMEVATVDHLSGGRVELGIGAGGAPLDAAYVGVEAWSKRERLDRLAEQVDILDRMLRGETVTSDARYPTTAARVIQAVQRPRPPIVIAAQGPTAMRVVARYADTWNTLGGQPMGAAPPIPLADALAETRRQIEALDSACRAVGRDPATVRRSVCLYKSLVLLQSIDSFEEVCSGYAALGFDEIVIYWPFLSPRAYPTEEIVRSSEAVLVRAMAEVVPRLRGGPGS